MEIKRRKAGLTGVQKKEKNKAAYNRKFINEFIKILDLYFYKI